MTKTLQKVKILDFIKSRPQLLILVTMVVVLAVINPKFSTGANLLNILKQVSVIAIISSGLTLVVVSGCLDLSVGSVLSLLNVITARLQLQNNLAAVVVPLFIALFIGLFNGVIVTKFKVNSIIVTLGSLSVFAGLALLFTQGAIIIGRTGTWYSLIAQGELWGIPIHVYIFIILAIGYELLLKKTRFGRGLIYTGTNEEAARVAGIRTALYRIIAFMISAFSVAIASIILSSRMNSGTPVAGVGFEFDAVTAILIGGTSLIGGRGSIINTIIGVLLLAVLINALTLYQVPFAFQNIFKGLLIILAIIVDVRSREKYGK